MILATRFLPHLNPCSLSSAGDPWAPIELSALSVDLPDMPQQLLIVYPPSARLTIAPCIISASGCFQYCIYASYPVHRSVLFNKPILHLLCLENRAKAFFKMSSLPSPSPIPSGAALSPLPPALRGLSRQRLYHHLPVISFSIDEANWDGYQALGPPCLLAFPFLSPVGLHSS